MAKIKINIGGVITEMESEEVSKGIEAGELKIESDDLTVLKKSDENIVYSKDDFETFKTNLANDEYKKGKTAGSEMLIKEAKEKHGLEFEGKTIDNFADAFKTKVITDAKIVPTERIAALEKDLETVRGSYKTLETEYTGFKTTITEQETRSKKDNAIMGFIPDNLIVDKDIAILSLKVKAGLDIDDNGFALINGIKQQDSKLMQDIPLNKDIVTEHLTTLGLIKKAEGNSNGDGDDLGKGSASNYDKFVKEMAANDIKEGSEKFGTELNKRVKEKTLVM